jgi:hypothetical protein
MNVLARLLPFLGIIGLVVAGCGASNATPKPTPVKANVFHDPKLHFSFQYDDGWTVPKKGGSYTSLQGVRTYVLNITTPVSVAGARITVDKDMVDYTNIPEGKIANDPNGGPDTFHYHHLTVSGWPSIQIERFSGTQIDGIDTITNTHQYSYDVQMITPSPPFPAKVLSGYRTIVKTLNLPF